MSIDDPVSSQTINSVPYTVSGTCSGGSGTYTSITFDDGSGPVPVTSGPVSSWTHSWSPTDGTYTLNAACTDDAAKTGNATAVTGVVINTCVDSDVATMAVSDPIESATIGGTYTVYGQVGVETAPLTMGTVEFNLNGAGWTAATGNNGSDSFTISWDTTLETDGPATIQVRGYDPDCGGTNLITSAVRNVTINNACSDSDIASWTITTPAESAAVSGSSYTITARVDTETAPLTMGTVEFNLNGAGWTSAGVYNNGVDSFQIDWDTTLESDGPATIQVRGFDPDCGGTNLITSTVRNVDVNNSGPSNTLADCGGCHNYPPVDALSRDATTGNFIGDHDKHSAYTCNTCHVVPGSESSADFAHRTGNLDMASGSIGVLDNGVYDVKGAVFAQSNTPTTSTCSQVNCHNNVVTPQWGVGTTACDTCHGLPPATNSHSAHYTAKGWSTGVATNCVYCHPDNTSGHSDVTDSSVLYNAALVIGGNPAPDVTCSSTDVGCHNGNTSPLWVTDMGTITCTDCHAVGGSNTATVANPVSGLHGNATASVQDHDATLTGGCEACHVKGSIAAHWDGVASATADYTKAAVGIDSAMYTDAGGTAATRGSCLSNTDLAACHSDGGEWRRLWSTDADADIVASPLPGQAVCNVCHGQYSTLTASTGWNEGTVHYRSGSGATENKGAIHTDVGDECEDCHGYDSAASHNGNNAIDFSDQGGSYTITLNTAPNPDVWYCATCHNSQNAQDATLTDSHTYLDSLAFPNSVAHVTGSSVPEGSCDTCHGGTLGTDANTYWPDSGVTNVDNGGSADDEGAHAKHMTVIARRLYNEDLTTLLVNNGNGDADVKQKAICDYCHQGSTNDGDHMTGDDAEVFPAGYRLTLAGAADGRNGNATYTTGTCSNVDCHNEQSTNTTYDWYSGATGTCTMCHTAGGTNDATHANPSSGLHTGSVPTISAQKHDDTLAGGCAACHTMPDLTTTQTTSHLNDLFTTDGSAHLTEMGLDASPYVNSSDNVGTCATSCHSGAGDNGSWTRHWDASIHYDPLDATLTECDGCHGGFSLAFTFGTVDDKFDNSVEHNWNWDGDGNTSEVIGNHPDATDKCKSCHGFGYAGVYDTSSFGAHRDGKITFNDEMGYNGSPNYDCTTYCHSDNASHGLEGSGWSTTGNTVDCPPLACTDCHATAATGSAGVGLDSPHSTNVTGYTCEYCHTGHNSGTIQIANKTFQDATEINYGTGGIDLGNSSGATGATEAEICWNCHTTESRDGEFGTNTGGTYNYGTLSTMNWFSANWTSGAGFTYKNGPLTTKITGATNHMRTSTHDTKNALGTSTEAVGDIRCSYCHDVHDTMGPTGKPFLRGTWTPNPFPEDGAPSGSNVGGNLHGGVPRGLGGSNPGTSNALGGWQIEQNNTSVYTSGKAYATHSGLCAKCHTEANVTGYWTSHRNVVDGFTDASPLNIYDEAKRGGQDLIGGPAYMQHQGVTDGDGWYYGLRNVKDNAGISPGIAGDTTPQKALIDAVAPYTSISYGASSSNADPDIHNFPCSKCHNPHASRLPALMITNCLDVKRNTWDDNTGSINAPSSMGQDTYAYMGYTSGQMAYSTTAANCHRYVKTGDANQQSGAGTENGWNLTTPWE